MAQLVEGIRDLAEALTSPVTIWAATSLTMSSSGEARRQQSRASAADLPRRFGRRTTGGSVGTPGLDEACRGRHVSRVLLVGKGTPDVGGIPTFLAMLQSSDLADEHEITFLNVAHAGVPEAGRWTMGNVTRTWHDTSSVWRMAKHNDVVHIHSALTPAVTVLRASMMAAAGRARGCGVVVHAHGGNLQMWLRDTKSRWILKLAMLPVDRVVPVWSAGEEALADVLGPQRVTPGRQRRRHRRVPPPRRSRQRRSTRPLRGAAHSAEGSGRPHRGVAAPHRARRRAPAGARGGNPGRRAGRGGRGHHRCLRRRRASRTVSVEQDASGLRRGRCLLPAVVVGGDAVSVLEAMACGLPVVASDVGDISRAIDDGTTGYVVPAKSPAKLADALERLLTDRELRVSMGQEGRRRVVAKFSQKVMARNISAVFADVMKSRR